MAPLTITDGRIATVSCRPPRLCSIRLAGPGDDLCVPDPANPPSMCTPASLANILSQDVPVHNVLAFPPQPITSPLAIEAADSSFTGIDFVPDSFAQGPVQRGAALYALEGDFGFSRANGDPEVGHEIKLLNFSKVSEPLQLQISRFAFNKTFEQAFVSWRHPRVQSSDQREVRAGRLRLGPRLRRGARLRPVRSSV